LPATHGLTLVVGLTALAVVFGLRIVAPHVPGALVLVVGGLLANWIFRLGDHGVAVVGDIPSGLPRLRVPDGQLLWEHAETVVTAAVALLLIGFSQTAGDARAFAAKHHYQIDIGQESVAQALANTGSGLFQGMPVSTSLSASSLNDHSGAKTGLASIVSGVTVLLTLLFLAPLFSGLPKPVLAALIIEAVVKGMMDVPEMRRLARVQRFDFWVAILAIVATLLVGVLAGVVIGVALSLLWLIAVSTHPNLPQLGRQPGTQVYRDIAAYPDDERIPGLVVVRMDAGLFFATADALEDRIRDLIHDRADLTGLVLDGAGMNYVDSQGSAKLAEIWQLADESRLDLRLARLSSSVTALIERDGVLDLIGWDHVHGNVDEAVRAHQADSSR
jgi:MFS superfamily sulfate permease-like transporter